MKYISSLHFLCLFLLFLSHTASGMDKTTTEKKDITAILAAAGQMLQQQTQQQTQQPSEARITVEPSTQSQDSAVEFVAPFQTALLEQFAQDNEWLKSATSLSKEDREAFVAKSQSKLTQGLQVIEDMKKKYNKQCNVETLLNEIRSHQPNLNRTRFDTGSNIVQLLLKLTLLAVVIYQTIKGQCPAITNS